MNSELPRISARFQREYKKYWDSYNHQLEETKNKKKTY